MNSRWKVLENRRKFLDAVKIKFNISTPRDWGRITVSAISNLGGSSLIKNYYEGSLFKCLQSIYSGKK